MIVLHQHPEVLDTLMTEIREVLGERTALTSDDLDKLVYTEQVNFHTMMHLAFKNSHSSDNQGSPEEYDVIGFMTLSKESPVGGVTLSGYYIPAGTIMTVSQINLIHY